MLPLRLFRLSGAAVCAAVSMVKPVWAEPAAVLAMENLLRQERAQLEAMGTNQAKKIAGVEQNSRIRVASLSKPKADDEFTISSVKQLNALPPASGGPQWACLTEAIYFEARGESFKSMAAVAEVIINRRNSSRFPDTICGVISQGSERRNRCQFSYKCDGRKEVFDDQGAYLKVGKLARLMLDGVVPKLTGGALFYHNATVKPRWSRKFRLTAKVGGHLFYKP